MKKLEVRLVREPGEERVVGQLAETGPRRVGGQVVFEYDPEFLRDPLWLSPFKLPPQPGLAEHRDRAFGPVFGLFDDSLPDGWGLLLMDRFFEQRGSALAEVSVLDRLAYLGTRTMGALTYHPPAEPADHDPQILDLHEMAEASRQVLAGTAREVLPQLLRAGGSPGGARPKVLVGVRGEEILSGEDDLPPGYAHWMVKLQAREDPPDAGAVELAYSRMARAAGLAMPPTRLFETARGERFFGVERFDRRGNRRYHVHTFGNLIHADFPIRDRVRSAARRATASPPGKPSRPTSAITHRACAPRGSPGSLSTSVSPTSGRWARSSPPTRRRPRAERQPRRRQSRKIEISRPWRRLRERSPRSAKGGA